MWKSGDAASQSIHQVLGGDLWWKRFSRNYHTGQRQAQLQQPSHRRLSHGLMCLVRALRYVYRGHRPEIQWDFWHWSSLPGWADIPLSPSSRFEHPRQQTEEYRSLGHSRSLARVYVLTVPKLLGEQDQDQWCDDDNWASLHPRQAFVAFNRWQQSRPWRNNRDLERFEL